MPAAQNAVHQAPNYHYAAYISEADADIPEIETSENAGINTQITPLPSIETQAEKKSIYGVTGLTKSTSHLPQDAASSPLKNVQTCPISPGVAAPTTQDLKTRETKKSHVKMYGVIAIVVFMALAGAYKLFSAKPPPTKPAEVRILSTPKGAAVSIDKTDVGDTPHTAVNINSGKHFISFTKEGYHSRSIEISLVEGRNPDMQVTLERSPQSKGTVAESIGATGGKPISSVKLALPKPTTPLTKQVSPSPLKALEKPIEMKIQDAIALYESNQYTAATKQFKSILEVVPNNSLAKFYYQKSADADGKQ